MTTTYTIPSCPSCGSGHWTLVNRSEPYVDGSSGDILVRLMLVCNACDVDFVVEVSLEGMTL